MSYYDFILFENYHLATHHKIDVVLIARMLKHEGLKVAILDIYGEYTENCIEGISVVRLPFTPQKPYDKWQLHPKNKMHSFFCKLFFLYKQHFYLKRVVKVIAPMADQFYCGSYHLGMSSQFFKMNKRCYYWGLRSERMNHFWKHFMKNPIDGIRLLQLKHAFLKNRLQCLFVSNAIIKDEFVRLGVSHNRIVMREERCVFVQGKDYLDQRNAETMFLVIGQLREQKHVDVTIEAFKNANILGSTLKLVGKCCAEYETVISTAINGDKRIERIREYLSYDDFNAWFRKSHFVLFADEQGPSCITNGTMMEALINCRPIICPDYNPYTYYIKKYGIGLLYNSNDIDSYTKALVQAAQLGTEYFIPNIKAFLETITFNNVSKQLVEQIRIPKV